MASSNGRALFAAAARVLGGAPVFALARDVPPPLPAPPERQVVAAAFTPGVHVIPPQQVAAQLRRLVEEAEQFLHLVCPYFKPWPQMQSEIASAVSRGVDVRLVVREDEVDRLRTHLEPCHRAGVHVSSVMKLHAKLYVTESAAILTSMNLVASSQESWELGILVERANAPDVHLRLRQQAEECVRIAHDVGPDRAVARPVRERRPSVPAAARAAGVCVRCAAPIRLDPKKPLCVGCYGRWRRYGNEDYPENCCHSCGKHVRTSVARPLCKPCYIVAGR